MKPNAQPKRFAAAAIAAIALVAAAAPALCFAVDPQVQSDQKPRPFLRKDGAARQDQPPRAGDQSQSPLIPPPPQGAMVLTPPPPGKLGTPPVQMGKLGTEPPRDAPPLKLGNDVPPGGVGLPPRPALQKTEGR